MKKTADPYDRFSPAARRDQSVTPQYRYGVYGIALGSDIPLPLPEPSGRALAEVELRSAPANWFAHAIQGAELQQISSSWYLYSQLPDRATYARWEGVGEFLVSADGKSIFCRQFDGTAEESFRVYLLG